MGKNIVHEGVERKNWLNETDVEFLIGEGPTEGGVQGVTKEGEAVVKVRVSECKLFAWKEVWYVCDEC